MPFRKIIIAIVIGSGAVVSANAINASYFSPFSWFLFLQIISGPLFIVAILPKKYWLRLNLFITTIAGIAGLVRAALSIGELYLSGAGLAHLNNSYVYQGTVSILFLMAFFVWLYFEKHSRTKEGENPQSNI